MLLLEWASLPPDTRWICKSVLSPEFRLHAQPVYETTLLVPAVVGDLHRQIALELIRDEGISQHRKQADVHSESAALAINAVFSNVPMRDTMTPDQVGYKMETDVDKVVF